jgi:hypothetical protein
MPLIIYPYIYTWIRVTPINWFFLKILKPEVWNWRLISTEHLHEMLDYSSGLLVHGYQSSISELRNLTCENFSHSDMLTTSMLILDVVEKVRLFLGVIHKWCHGFRKGSEICDPNALYDFQGKKKHGIGGEGVLKSYFLLWHSFWMTPHYPAFPSRHPWGWFWSRLY